MDWFVMTTLPTPDSARVEVTDATGFPAQLTVSEAVIAVNCFKGGLCVPDIYALVRNADGGAVHPLCQLAKGNRVLCRAVTGRRGCASGSPAEILAYFSDSRAEAEVVARHGPGGVFAATRGTLALGAASAAGLTLDPRAATDAAEFCRTRADKQFQQLMAHPDADTMFEGGNQTTANAKGFRPTQTERTRAWLRDRLTTVTDRLRLPVPTPSNRPGKSIYR